MLGFRSMLAAWLLLATITDGQARTTSTDRLQLITHPSRRAPDYVNGVIALRKHRKLRSVLTAVDSRPSQSIIELIDNSSQAHRGLKHHFGKGKSKSKKGNKSKSGSSDKGGKSSSKGKSKGKSKSKGSKGKGKGSSGGGDLPDLPKVCEKLDFRGFPRRRKLQFDGPLCQPNVLQTAYNIPEISIFVDLVEAANLDPIFLCAGPFTVLPPTNEAFEGNPDLYAYLSDPANLADLQQVILYHILPGLELTESMVEGSIVTLQGEDIDVTREPLKFNQEGLVDGDIIACNGALNIIDGVLIPPSLELGKL